jgi:hypothetical protein
VPRITHRDAGKTIQLATYQMPQRMTGKGVQRKQRCAEPQYQTTDTQPELMGTIDGYKNAGMDNVNCQEDDKYQGDIKKETVQVLK